MGASALIRPAGEFLSAVLLLALGLEHARQPLVLARYAVGGMLVFALVLSPWLVRNWRIFGHAFLTTSGSYYLLTMNVAPMLAQERGQGWAQTEQDLNREVGAPDVAERESLVSYGAAIAGLLRSLRTADRAPVVLLAALVVYFTVVAGAGGLARYKLPAIPCYLPFTALGVQAWMEWARRLGR